MKFRKQFNALSAELGWNPARWVVEMERVGWSRSISTVIGWIKGTATPNAEDIFAICKATGRSADWILGVESADTAAVA